MSSAENVVELSPSSVNFESLSQTLESEGKVVCPSPGCNADFKSLWGLRYHLRRCSQQGDWVGFTCDHCGVTFSSRVSLRQHVATCEDIGTDGEFKPFSPSQFMQSVLVYKFSLHYPHKTSCLLMRIN